MQTANPDIVRYLERGFECWNRRAIAEMMDMYAQDAEVDLSNFLPDENVLRGRKQIGAYYDRMWDTWSGFSWKPCEWSTSVTTGTRCSCASKPRDAAAARPPRPRPRSSTRSPTA